MRYLISNNEFQLPMTCFVDTQCGGIIKPMGWSFRQRWSPCKENYGHVCLVSKDPLANCGSHANCQRIQFMIICVTNPQLAIIRIGTQHKSRSVGYHCCKGCESSNLTTFTNWQFVVQHNVYLGGHYYIHCQSCSKTGSTEFTLNNDRMLQLCKCVRYNVIVLYYYFSSSSTQVCRNTAVLSKAVSWSSSVVMQHHFSWQLDIQLSITVIPTTCH